MTLRTIKRLIARTIYTFLSFLELYNEPDMKGSWWQVMVSELEVQLAEELELL